MSNRNVLGVVPSTTGIVPFMTLAAQVMTTEPYASANRVFWLVDNGSSHRGQAAIDRLTRRFPNAVMVHTRSTRPGSTRRRSTSPWCNAKSCLPNDFTNLFTNLDEVEQRLAAFEQRDRETIPAAHAILAARGEWITNEKQLLTRAGLRELDDLLGPGRGHRPMRRAVSAGKYRRHLTPSWSPDRVTPHLKRCRGGDQ